MADKRQIEDSGAASCSKVFRLSESETKEECLHKIVCKDLCAQCGKDLKSASEHTTETRARVSMIHHIPELVVTAELADEISDQDKVKLLMKRKLILLCDLDQTLIHSSDRLPKPDEQSKDLHQFDMGGVRYYTKIRPFVPQFLEAMSKMFEMSIVTYGNRIYAHTIARILDPTEVYFGHRILSRNELVSDRYKTRNIASIFPKSEELIVVIDDRSDVWLHSDSLICVKPYKYFSDVSDINASSKFSFSTCFNNSSIGESLVVEEDDELEYMEKILSSIHSQFYQYYDRDKKVENVKNIANLMRSKVLKGERIVLSGMVPLDADKNSSMIYKIIHQYGAVIEEKITEETTVLVATRLGTDKKKLLKRKVKIAKSIGIPIVSHRWLKKCIERWVKLEKNDYLLQNELDDTSNCIKLSNAMADMDTISKDILKEMNDEVDEALSESGSSNCSKLSKNSVIDSGSEEESPNVDKKIDNVTKTYRLAVSDDCDYNDNSQNSGLNSDSSSFNEDFDDMVKSIEDRLKD